MDGREAPGVSPLTCYRVRSQIDGRPVVDFDDVVDFKDHTVETVGPVQRDDFTAKAYVVDSMPRPVAWAGFVQSGFPGLEIGWRMSPSALVVVGANPADKDGTGRSDLMFAFAFGLAGRHLLRSDAYERGYGLRTALNLLYPRGAQEAAMLRAVDSKRRGETTVRARFQVSGPADFEIFDVNRLRDVVNRATGKPADVGTWGQRLGGGDSLALNIEASFDQLGELCRRVETAHGLEDYKERFDWIDFIQPVTDPLLIERLENEIVGKLRSRQLGDLGLAPPEIVDWDRVAAFRYSFDRVQGPARTPVTHPDLSLADYVTGLSRKRRLAGLEVAQLRASGAIRALDGDGHEQHRWTAWRCLFGEFVLDRESYVLDEGEFFQVRADYLQELDTAIDGIPTSNLALPASTPTTPEGEYNRSAASGSPGLALLDRETVRISGRTSPVEICDLLSRDRQLIHVKRHLGSSDLSHLFAQGLVSAELLQMSREFRREANAKVVAVAQGRDGFDFLDQAGFVPSDFEVVYAVIERWRGRRCAEALPFFSKINLREVATNLQSRGFRVGLNQIQA